MIRSLLMVLMTAGVAAAEEGHAHHAAVEETVKIGTLHGQMKYDVDRFTVTPGAKVTLVFENTDEMQHNLVICKPGEGVFMEVAQKAWALGEKAIEKQFVPDDPRVLFFTEIIDPGQMEKLEFTAPLVEGDYPYVCTLPGHAMAMNGVMRVGSAASGLREMGWAAYEGKWMELPDFAALEPVATGELEGGLIHLDDAPREDFFGMVFSGLLDVPAEGEYTFFLNSDDGARVLIDERPVVTYDGVHAAEGDQEGKVKLTAGAHRIRVQFFEYHHGQELHLAWSGPGMERTPLTKKGTAKPPASNLVLEVKDEPLVIRSFLEDGPPRAIAVGLPGGVNYCFDADTCGVAFGWTGKFLDVKPDRGGDIASRGGGWSKVLGERFGVGAEGFPLRFGEAGKEPEVRFGGYRRGSSGAGGEAGATASRGPEFLMTADGVEVVQRVRGISGGLEYEFELEGVKTDVFFVVDPSGLELSSSAGRWDGGTLRVPKERAGSFSVKLVKR